MSAAARRRDAGGVQPLRGPGQEAARLRPRLPPLESAAEEAREEFFDPLAEVHGAVADLLPGAPGRGLGGLPRLLDFLARELRALDDGLADPLGGFLGALEDLALADLLGAALDLAGGGLDLRVGCGGARRGAPPPGARGRGGGGRPPPGPPRPPSGSR